VWQVFLQALIVVNAQAARVLRSVFIVDGVARVGGHTSVLLDTYVVLDDLLEELGSA